MCQLSALSECSELWKLSRSSQVRDVCVRVCVYVDVRMRVCANAGVSQACVSMWRIPLLPCPVLTCVCVCFVCACVRVTPSPSLQICNRICGSGQCLSTENLQGFTSAQNYIRDSRWGLAHRRTLSPSEFSLTPSLFSAGLSRSFRESRNPPGREKTGFQALRTAHSLVFLISALLCYFPKSVAPRESSPVVPWEIDNWAFLICVVFFAWDIAKAYSLR